MRFESVTENVKVLEKRVRKEYFPELVNCKIKLLFDLKRRLSGGKIVLGRIQKTTDLTRHLTIDEAGSEVGYDYIMYLDRMAYNNIEDEDRIRLIRHELRHCFVDIETSGNPCKTIGHSIEDFYEEVELNQDDPRWCQRVAELTMHLYQQEREMNE